jgi:small subunit ribosomal protein S9
MNNKIESIFKKDKVGIGKRKQSVARVFLVPGTGNIVINNIPGEKYLQYNLSYLNNIWAPLQILNLEKQFDIITIVRGGGITGQASSIQLGIARLLCKMEKQNRILLKPHGFLTRDARIKERKKYGLRKARKAPQYSKR